MLGKRIKTLREMNGISQKKLAERLNLSQQAIAMWETEKREPDIRMLNNLCDIFDVDINYLLGKTNIAKPSGANSAEEKPVRTVRREDISVSFHSGNYDDISEEAIENILDLVEFARAQDLKKQETKKKKE